MDQMSARVEAALDVAFASVRGAHGPPRLTAGLEHAVFPGGARLRPQLVLRVARALGDPAPALTDAAAAAVELLHCASLVHDDLPCFDDAQLRRGRPTVHAAFGESTAVLVGDALIVLGFETLAKATTTSRGRLAAMTIALARAVGHTDGIIAGQAWEAEPSVALLTYHRAKTAALFECACVLGALAAGADPSPWRSVGELLGRAYQVADDLADVTLTTDMTGKDANVDRARHRPNVVHHFGEAACRAMLTQLLQDAADAVPSCPGRDALTSWLRETTYGVLRVRGSIDAQSPPREAVDTSDLNRVAAD